MLSVYSVLFICRWIVNIFTITIVSLKFQGNTYYKARFDPPKKENKPRDKLSANIQKFLAKKEEEERQKQLEAQRKREELLAMRDPKVKKS